MLPEIFYENAVSFYKLKLADDPENYFYLSSIGLAYAGLNRKTEAIEAGEKAVNSGMAHCIEIIDRMIDLAKIYVITGEYDRGIKQLENLLKTPSTISAELLKIDPVWLPLRNNSEFEKLLLNYSID